MIHADMQPCSLGDELLIFLVRHTLHPVLANVLMDPAAVALNKHRSLVDVIALAEAILVAFQLTATTRSGFDTT